MSKGKLIVIDGLDGSGKATQSLLLQNKLASNGVKSKLISFPNYESLSSGPVRMYLGGELADSAEKINAHAAAAMFAVDRYCGFMADFGEFYDNGGVLICDRYTTANAIHQCAKLPSEKREEFADWLFDFEYEKLGLPKPDMVIFLSVSEELTSKLLSKRYGGDESKRDIHERDDNHRRSAKATAEFMCERYDWKKIICDNGEEMLSRNELSRTIYDLVADII